MEINQSSVTTFILLGFSKLPQIGILLFTLFFLIYSLSIVGNLLIVLLVVADHRLHTPMYFFLVNLSCLETCYISTILPRMLASFVTEDKSISVYGCMTQYYFFGFLASTECYLLAMMSYDRYLAICKPLHYASFMNGKLCLQLALTSWISGLLTNTVVTAFLLQLNFCGPNEIDHFFCDVYPVANLSCSNTHLVKLSTFILGFMSIGIPFLLTMTSYIYILYTVWQMKSKKAQQKAFSTCSSHLTVVSFFFVSLLLVYVVPETERLKELHKIFSLFYTVLTPTVNPIIYSLRNREVKEAFFKIVRKYSNIVL
ncbi:olfactory receptor 11L1-like [Crotalus tigris]|uniref:olfactory receptor 11L1-like n=1 Tax=Crotalus tigris TaxID=88082 RepID=UPI00192F8E70|nr:olfactory receptor 11L1-like [Crotalus tigris]XP_039213821.1 olfactory receptor 11L1-like [Crotalus tigris]XP_039213822.1 olfactory receptor 11L1-like [Crotalus tigris]XP_039213823.1 olfactory receptor 11L1-like [Crotalus tigris]